MNPLVSVIIPLYNHERYIASAIGSVLKQSFSDFELIIINDGSTDQSEEIINKIKDKRINYYFQKNSGASDTINKGIKLAKGKYISILNSDDIYAENRLEKCLETVKSTKKEAIFSRIQFIDTNGKIVDYNIGQDWNLKHGEPTFQTHRAVILDLLGGNFLHTTSNLFCRKQVFEEIGYFSNLRYTHDYDFFLRLCVRYPIGIIEEPLLYYRFHDANTLGDDFANSNFETGLILANFLLQHDLSAQFQKEDSIFETMAKFYNSLNSYGTDRLILTLLLFNSRYNLPSSGFFDQLCQNKDNPLRNACLQDQRMNRDALQLHHDLKWQTSQTEIWWRKVGELSETLKWQKGETERWWSDAEKLKQDLAWQQQQTSHWWEQEQKLKQDLFELNTETDALRHQLMEIKNSMRWQLACKVARFFDKLLPPTFRARVRQQLRQGIGH